MGVVEVLDPVRSARTGGYKVDVSRGEWNGRVSSEWFNRPDDERYLSLDDLWGSVKGRSERSRSRVVQTADIRVEAARDNGERLHLMLPKAQEPVAPTHWAFGQLASIVGAPASYLRQLPAPLAGINLQYGLSNHRAEQVKTFETEDGRTELRAVTGPDYGRTPSPQEGRGLATEGRASIALQGGGALLVHVVFTFGPYGLYCGQRRQKCKLPPESVNPPRSTQSR